MLMSIIFRLAGNAEYNQGRIPAYIKDIDEYFGKYKNHPAVATEARPTRSAAVEDIRPRRS